MKENAPLQARGEAGHKLDKTHIAPSNAQAKTIPPLCWHAGGVADLLMDRIALHLRREAPEQFGAMTLDEIGLTFDALRSEIRRLLLTDEFCSDEEEG
jgi:hypothetical protein